MGIIFYVSDGSGNKFEMQRLEGQKIDVIFIIQNALQSEKYNSKFNLGLLPTEGEKNIQLKLNEEILDPNGQLVAGIDINDNDTIVAHRVQEGGAKNHKRKVRKKTNKKRRKKTNKKLRISKSRNRKNRKHNIRKSNTRKRNTRKRY